MASPRDNLLVARFGLPAFNPTAHGVALDWNTKIEFINGGKHFKKALQAKGFDAGGLPDIAAVVGFLQARKDKHGQPIDNLFGPPELQADGWYRMISLSHSDLFTASGRCHSWQTAWHGCERLNH
jgi:hypothetical protein